MQKGDDNNQYRQARQRRTVQEHSQVKQYLADVYRVPDEPEDALPDNVRFFSNLDENYSQAGQRQVSRDN